MFYQFDCVSHYRGIVWKNVMFYFKTHKLFEPSYCLGIRMLLYYPDRFKPAQIYFFFIGICRLT